MTVLASSKSAMPTWAHCLLDAQGDGLAVFRGSLTDKLVESLAVGTPTFDDLLELRGRLREWVVKEYMRATSRFLDRPNYVADFERELDGLSATYPEDMCRYAKLKIVKMCSDELSRRATNELLALA